MIYLVQSYRLTEENDPTKGVCSCEKILKIGFTADENEKRRLYAYTSHNPGTYVLQTIKGATEVHEKKLHHKFRDLKLDNWREWFKYDQKIIDYLGTITLNDLDNLQAKVVDKGKNFKIQLKRVIDFYSALGVNFREDKYAFNNADLFNEILHDVDIVDINEVFCYLGLSGEDLENIKKILSNDYSDRSKKEQDFFFNLNDETQFVRKMKLLCDYDFKGEELDYVLRQLPSEFAKYYYVLGPEIIKARAYNRSYLEKDYDKLMFNSDYLKNDIYNSFSEGEKLTTQEIVDRLIPIYEKYGSPNKPKGTDINDYFETKVAMIGSKTRVRGFRLIKRLK